MHFKLKFVFDEIFDRASKLVWQQKDTKTATNRSGESVKSNIPKEISILQMNLDSNGEIGTILHNIYDSDMDIDSTLRSF